MVLTDAIIVAAERGDVAAIEQWLDAGGDANDRCAHSGGSLLHLIAGEELCNTDEVERGRCDIARLLLGGAGIVVGLATYGYKIMNARRGVVDASTGLLSTLRAKYERPRARSRNSRLAPPPPPRLV